ncbi:MAG: alpha-mannosidase [Clostridia bacterium]|nr:alpha-mannosidase [Clostridia bacterium]
MTFEKYVERTLGKIENTLELYGRHIFRPLFSVDTVLGMETQEHLRLPPPDADMAPIAPGTAWGKEYGNLWLKCRLNVPEAADGRILCALCKSDAVEILCFKDGKPAGIINSKNRFIGGNHSVMFVSPRACAGAEIELAFECYSGHTCLGTQPVENYDADEDTVNEAAFRHVYSGIDICVMNETVRDAVFDMATAVQLARLPADNYASQKAYRCLVDALPHIIQDQRGVSEEEIVSSAEKIIEILAPVLKKTHADASRGMIGVTGHSHMDTAWLWPVSETIRKCARTYSQALTLMDMYPDYTFIQSSALHLDWMRRYYPDIFEGIRRRVKEGRYEPNGGVWVECDCNITGGEAMARQFLYGQRFTRKYLDYTSDCFWLPDTFGYNAAIPQIMLLSGVKYFYTTKLSWNDLNRFPAGTFVWKGIDGSEVLCHLNATHSVPDPKTITGNYANVTDRRTEPMRFAAYGFGDGGGGPTYGMLEYLKRVTDLEGLPVVKSCSASRFMQETEKNRASLPVCDGELYLELHRGTLTKMHDVKKNNRLAEIALHDYELLSVLSGKNDNEQRGEYWKILLKNQFHDILPGTCIPKVYEEEVPEMQRLLKDIKSSMELLAGEMGAKENAGVSVFNPLSFDRSDPVVLDGSFCAGGYASQTYQDIEGETKTAVAAPVAAMSALTLTRGEPAGQSLEMPFRAGEISNNGFEVETPFYTARFDADGHIVFLTDKRVGRTILPANSKANLSSLYFGEEMSAAWDNWDIDNDAFEKLLPVSRADSVSYASVGTVELRLRAEYRFGRSSSAVVDTVFYASSPRIDFEVRVNWQERHGLLKAVFSTDIRSPFVKNEIQFGHIDRPTTRNNSIEEAKFEVCNQKWSDLSETHYGIALLNDCKYGMSALGGEMALTLMKGGSRPDPKTDIGVHTMRYALLPHLGAFSAENVVRPAYEFNCLHRLFAGGLTVPCLFEISDPGIICEAAKPAEDIEGAFVLRLYECERNHTSTVLRLYGCKKASLVNILEETICPIELNENGECRLDFHPFEVKTVLAER